MFKHKEAAVLVKNNNDLAEYVAFHAKDKTRHLEVIMAREASHAPDYRYLLNITYDHQNWTDFVLTYSFMQVQVMGRNLENVYIAIRNNNCEWIREFDGSVFAQPKPDAALIESIKVIVKV